MTTTKSELKTISLLILFLIVILSNTLYSCKKAPKGESSVMNIISSELNGSNDMYEDFGLSGQPAFSNGQTGDGLSSLSDKTSSKSLSGLTVPTPSEGINQNRYTGPYSIENGTFEATDGLGRKIAVDGSVSLPRKDHYVGIFYLLWLGQHGSSGPYDNNKIFTQDKSSAYDESKWGPLGAHHFWGEPLYGYYTSNDEWVYRRHIRMLTDANVDFLGIDATNAVTYENQALLLMSLLYEYQAKGWNVPKVSFYTNTNSGVTMNKIFQTIYVEHPEYQSLWFYWEGKPLIIGDAADPALLGTAKSFFRIKANQWPNEPVKADGFPWISFERIPHVFKNSKGENEVVVVSPAQHPNINFALTAFYGHAELNWPRTYHDGANDLSAGAVNYGYNFAEMFEFAIKQDPKIIFITEWNEWVAQRQPAYDLNEPIVFVDCADPNCSRDIEPMRGGFGDNYYLQMIDLIRKFKGASPRVNTGAYKTIDINGSFSQWSSVTAVYKSYANDLQNRNAKGFGSLVYQNTTGRNDFDTMKVARDKTNLYFYVRTVDDITSSSQNRWMNLFINTNTSDSLNWNSYDFVLNRVSPVNGRLVIEKCMGGWTWSKVDGISYRVSGNEMQLCIPQALLGVDTTKSPLHIEFKWVDNYQGEDDIYSFYEDGDAAPLGRLNYVFAE